MAESDAVSRRISVDSSLGTRQFSFLATTYYSACSIHRDRLLCGWPRRNVVLQEPCQQTIEMVGRSRAFDNGVGPSGISHEVKRFAQFDQPVDQQLCALVVHVVIARAMHQQ